MATLTRRASEGPSTNRIEGVVTPTYSKFAQGLVAETAFTVLAIAKKLKATGKDVVELEIGDSPFPSTKSALAAGIEAIEAGLTRYCPSHGIPEFREAAAQFVAREFGIAATADNIVVGPGAKIFETFFCETFLDPGDGVLVFGPYFPTYIPNIERRGARVWLSDLREVDSFRPRCSEVERFLRDDPRPRAIFLNSPHNPTGGVATAEDLVELANLVRGRPVAVFCDEPYCHMVWSGRHHSLLAQPGMLDQAVAAYTFSKSYSMSGWRLGFCVAAQPVAELIGKMINTTLSCVPPIVQRAGRAALEQDRPERDEAMGKFRAKVELLTAGLRQIPDVRVIEPAGTFYVFPNVARICNRLGITSQGLALYLLEGADDRFGVACLGGECFGPAGRGFLRFSCAEPDDRIQQAIRFLPDACGRSDRVQRYLGSHPEHRLAEPYAFES
jgi:aspartate aminotransferase